MTENIHYELQEEPIVEIIDEPTSKTLPGIVFTRYLYIKKEVEHSLTNAILKRDREQSLFWAYELYYSGFRYDLIELLSNLYDKYYSHYTKLEMFLNKQCIELCENPTYDWIVGTIVRNMVYCKIQSIQPINPRKNVYVMLNSQDISEYRTIDHDKYISRIVLKNVCKYTPWRAAIQVIGIPEIPFTVVYQEDGMKIEEKYYYHWLYYAAFSPIWKIRIREFGGVQNHETLTVDFPDDEQYENFYELYQYEPDEQSILVQNQNIPKITQNNTFIAGASGMSKR